MKLLRVEVRNFRLEGRDVIWDINPDASILLGANGCGKTTLLQLIVNTLAGSVYDATLASVENVCLYFEGGYRIEMDGDIGRTFTGSENLEIPFFEWIQTFDVPNLQGKKSILDDKLAKLSNDFLLFQSYLRKDIDKLYTQSHKFSAEEKKEIEQNIQKQNTKREKFESIVNEFFADSDKQLETEESFLFRYKNEVLLTISVLSSGEKQLLLILLSVFLQNEKPFLLLLDEPEISMHIYWQRKLLTKIREINPNCQLLVVTHSSTLLGRGWMENFKRFEDICFPYKEIPPFNLAENTSSSSHNIGIDEEKIARITKKLEHPNRNFFQKQVDFPLIIQAEDNFTYLEVEKLLAILSEKGIHLHIIYSVLLKKIDWENAQQFWQKEMINNKRYVDISHLNILLKKAPNVQQGLDLIEKWLVEFEILPSTLSFSMLLGKTISTKEIDEVEKWRTYYGIEDNDQYHSKLHFKNYQKI